MQNLTFSIIVFISSFSNAMSSQKVKLMECNVSSGDYQQVSIYQEGSQLVLWTLNRSGIKAQNVLPMKQWHEKKISVPCAYQNGQCGFVSLLKNRWVYKIGSNSYFDIGNCH